MGKKARKAYQQGYLDALEDVLNLRVLAPKRTQGPRDVGCNWCLVNWDRGYKANGRHKNKRVREFRDEAIRRFKKR